MAGLQKFQYLLEDDPDDDGDEEEQVRIDRTLWSRICGFRAKLRADINRCRANAYDRFVAGVGKVAKKKEKEHIYTSRLVTGFLYGTHVTPQQGCSKICWTIPFSGAEEELHDRWPHKKVPLADLIADMQSGEIEYQAGLRTICNELKMEPGRVKWFLSQGIMPNNVYIRRDWSECWSDYD